MGAKVTLTLSDDGPALLPGAPRLICLDTIRYSSISGRPGEDEWLCCVSWSTAVVYVWCGLLRLAPAMPVSGEGGGRGEAKQSNSDAA